MLSSGNIGVEAFLKEISPEMQGRSQSGLPVETPSRGWPNRRCDIGQVISARLCRAGDTWKRSPPLITQNVLCLTLVCEKPCRQI
jgi:hypothetical protein